MKNEKLLMLVFIACATGLFSCQKEIRTNSLTLTKEATKSSYPNDLNTWYQLTTMPVLTGATAVSMPWNTSSGTPMDTYLKQDYQYADGWRIIYNTFSTSIDPATKGFGDMYFALYNKYRGLLRFYLYIPCNCLIATFKMENRLSTYPGLTSKMLNFDGYDIVDATSNTPAILKDNNLQTTSLCGWLVTQYQVAYDPAFASTSNYAFKWHLNPSDIWQINFDGTNAGTINGNLTKRGTGFDYSNSSVVTQSGSTAAEIFGAYTGGQFNNAIPTAYGGTGTKGFFDAIFGGNSSNANEVDMKINTVAGMESDLNGTGFDLNFNAPGQTNNTTNDNLPLYLDGALGVFNFPANPVVHITSVNTSAPTLWDGPSNKYYVNYLDASAWLSTIQKNPAVTSSATVTASAVVLLENFDAASSFYEYNRVAESVGNKAVVVNQTIDGKKILATDCHGYVRVYVTVTPTNGTTPASTIVKTFPATFTNP